MVADGYKDTEIGVIPVEWEVVKLDNLLEKFQNGYAFSSKGYKESGIPIISMASISLDGKFQFNYEKAKYWDSGKLDELEAFTLNKNDLIIAMTDVTPDKKLIGRMAIVDIDDTFLLNQRVGLLKLKDNINNIFLSNYSNHTKWRSYSKNISALGAQANLSTKDIKEAKIPLPPLKEQAKIAEILSTADQMLDAIEEQIQKAETLKKGLLQKLLSEGIGHSKFKDSELGKIPESWKVVELATITTILLSNVDKKSKKDEQKVKLCNYMDVYNNQYITNDLVYMEATAKDNQIEKFQLQINDVIITKDSETKDDIAIPAVVKETSENLICGYHLAVLRPKEDILYGVYLMKAIQSVNVHKHFEKLANGITRFGLTSSAINQALIPLPSLEEQKEIANILSSLDNKLVVLRAKKEKYETLKKGLLQKLLSGEVRV